MEFVMLKDINETVVRRDLILYAKWFMFSTTDYKMKIRFTNGDEVLLDYGCEDELVIKDLGRIYKPRTKRGLTVK